MARQVELGGISVVAAGSFNPAIFHPWWFADKELMPQNAIEDALEREFVAVRQLATFTADWLSVQVTLEQAVFSTVEEEENSTFGISRRAYSTSFLKPRSMQSVLTRTPTIVSNLRRHGMQSATASSRRTSGSPCSRGTSGDVALTGSRLASARWRSKRGAKTFLPLSGPKSRLLSG